MPQEPPNLYSCLTARKAKLLPTHVPGSSSQKLKLKHLMEGPTKKNRREDERYLQSLPGLLLPLPPSSLPPLLRTSKPKVKISNKSIFLFLPNPSHTPSAGSLKCRDPREKSITHSSHFPNKTSLRHRESLTLSVVSSRGTAFIPHTVPFTCNLAGAAGRLFFLSLIVTGSKLFFFFNKAILKQMLNSRCYFK